MTIPFLKAHGAGNDFLLTWADSAPVERLGEAARAICDRHTGMGGDGWMIVQPDAIRLFNADGGEAELSGNGTRCAAAVLVDAGLAGETVTLRTGAGVKTLRLKERQGRRFVFEMDMGQPEVRAEDVRYALPLRAGPLEVTIVDVGNPQCAVFVEQFAADWERQAAEIEGHAHFPKRTNVSYVVVRGEHSIEARFYERGVGTTLSSGTGSTGAAVAAIARGEAKSPVRIGTAAGPMELRWEESAYLTGPAEITGAGSFYWHAPDGL